MANPTGSKIKQRIDLGFGPGRAWPGRRIRG